jgi:hypothetical protein
VELLLCEARVLGRDEPPEQIEREAPWPRSRLGDLDAAAALLALGPEIVDVYLYEESETA